jgi:hypothetical protein
MVGRLQASRKALAKASRFWSAAKMPSQADSNRGHSGIASHVLCQLLTTFGLAGRLYLIPLWQPQDAIRPVGFRHALLRHFRKGFPKGFQRPVESLS